MSSIFSEQNYTLFLIRQEPNKDGCYDYYKSKQGRNVFVIDEFDDFYERLDKELRDFFVRHFDHWYNEPYTEITDAKLDEDGNIRLESDNDYGGGTLDICKDYTVLPDIRKKIVGNQDIAAYYVTYGFTEYYWVVLKKGRHE